MPSSHRHFRALKEDFRLLVSRRREWPGVKSFVSHLQIHADGGDKADVTRMKRGEVVPEKYVIAMIALMRGAPVLKEYLTGQGIEDTAALTDGEILDHVAGPMMERPVPDGEDWFSKGIDGAVSLFGDYVWGKLEREGTCCANEDDVRKAALMVLATYSQHHQPGNASLTEEAAITIAEAGMEISRENYCNRAVGLWQRAPWSVAYAVVDRIRVGCNIILPLKESVFEEIRAGSRSVFSCTADDLTLPTSYFFLEAVAERPEAEYPHTRKRTGQQIRTSFLQIAHMSLGADRDPLQQDRAIRVLTVAATPVNKKRLKNYGYRSLNVTVYGQGVELFENTSRKAWFHQLIVGYLHRRIRGSKP